MKRLIQDWNAVGHHDSDSEGDVRAIWTINHINNQSNEEYYNIPFTIVELNSVNSLPTTTPGNDGIYPHFIKNLSENWVATLSDIINLLWFHNEFPEIWKEGVAVMLPKYCKDLTSLKGYISIILLPVLGEAYERPVKNKINYIKQGKNLDEFSMWICQRS